MQQIQDTVFPQAVQKLQQCNDAAAIANWKKVVCEFINEKKVAGEPYLQLMIGINPQDEEHKENLTMAQRVYLRAFKLETSITNVNLSFEGEIKFF